MHLIAIRRELYDQHPWIARSLYDAFVAAKARAIDRMHYGGSLSVMLPWLMSEVEEVDALFGGDAWPYGIEPNRPTLEALVRYMVEQSFIARPLPIEELFVPVDS
jgi:4,5-dihydroxyphthalate decarboxylase